MKRSNVNVCEKSSTKVTLNEEFSTVKVRFTLYYQCQGFELSIKILPASWLINAKSNNSKDLNWNNIRTSSLMWAKKVVRQTGKFSNESTKNHFWKLISKQWVKYRHSVKFDINWCTDYTIIYKYMPKTAK